jgi:hypothetical protein
MLKTPKPLVVKCPEACPEECPEDSLDKELPKEDKDLKSMKLIDLFKTC